MTIDVEPVVSVAWLKDEIEKGEVRVIDVAYTLGPRQDPKEFKEKYYGKFEELIAHKVNADYTSAHIHGAAHFDLDIGQYPGETERFALYPPELFEDYVRRLGILESEHIVIVGRGPLGGLLFAARVWWLFKVYGHARVSVLDGGLDAWKAAGGAIDDKVVHTAIGDWTAKEFDPNLLVTFKEIDFHNLDQVNYLDARPKAVFNGTEPLGIPFPVPGAHVKGAKNVPVPGLVEAGHLASVEKINQELAAANYDATKPTITACTGGIQASLLALALARAGNENVKVYNGSLFELAQLAPDLVSEK